MATDPVHTNVKRPRHTFNTFTHLEMSTLPGKFVDDYVRMRDVTKKAPFPVRMSVLDSCYFSGSQTLHDTCLHATQYIFSIITIFHTLFVHLYYIENFVESTGNIYFKSNRKMVNLVFLSIIQITDLHRLILFFN